MSIDSIWLSLYFEVFIEILLVVVYEKFLLLTDAFLWGDYSRAQPQQEILYAIGAGDARLGAGEVTVGWVGASDIVLIQPYREH